MKGDRSPLEHFGILPDSAEVALLRLLLTTAVETVEAEEGSLLLREEGTGDLYFAMTTGSPDLVGQRVPALRGVSQLAAVTREVQIGAPTYRDIEQTQRQGEGPEAVIAAPLIAGDEVLGVLTGVTFEKGRRFDGSDAKLYGSLATIAAVLIEQHQRISGMEGRIAIQTTATLPGHNDKLREIDQALSRIAARQPQALSQIAAIVASFEAAVLR